MKQRSAAPIVRVPHAFSLVGGLVDASNFLMFSIFNIHRPIRSGRAICNAHRHPKIPQCLDAGRKCRLELFQFQSEKRRKTDSVAQM
jgi:hypothetical protein